MTQEYLQKKQAALTKNEVVASRVSNVEMRGTDDLVGDGVSWKNRKPELGLDVRVELRGLTGHC